MSPKLLGRARLAAAAPERLLTVREAAARLQVSRATVYALVERGALPHVRVSNAIRLRGEDIDGFIRRGGR